MPRERTYLRYQVYRSQARKQAGITFAKLHEDLQHQGIVDVDHSKVRFEAIDAQALDAYEEWLDPHFSWLDVVRWKAKEPLGFDLVRSGVVRALLCQSESEPVAGENCASGGQPR